MNKIEVHKAQGLSDGHVESVIISISKEQSQFDHKRTIEEVNGRFNTDAEAVVNALLVSLPQGTVDRVLSILMMKKATSLIIPFDG